MAAWDGVGGCSTAARDGRGGDGACRRLGTAGVALDIDPGRRRWLETARAGVALDIDPGWRRQRSVVARGRRGLGRHLTASARDMLGERAA